MYQFEEVFLGFFIFKSSNLKVCRIQKASIPHFPLDFGRFRILPKKGLPEMLSEYYSVSSTLLSLKTLKFFGSYKNVITFDRIASETWFSRLLRWLFF